MLSIIHFIFFDALILLKWIASSALQQSDAAVNGTVGSGAGSPVSNLVSRLGSFTFRRTSSGRVETTTDSESDEAVLVGGSFFETLTSSEFYKNTKVSFFCSIFEAVMLTCSDDQSLT